MKKKYHEIWENIKIKLNIKFHSMLAYDETYIKAKARKFSDVFETNFLGGEAPKENIQQTCIACITIDSFMRMEKKNHLQVYLEEWNYRIKKIQMSRFINTELKPESKSESGTELMAKRESNSDTE